MLTGKCRQASQLLSAGLDRPLSLTERLPLQVHLLTCTGCRAFQAQMRFLREASRHLSGKDHSSP